MSKWKNILRDVGYFGVGTAAVILEAGGKAVKSLVRKGAETLQDNQDTVDDLKQKAKDLGQKAKSAMKKPAKAQVDAAQLSPEARAELRRQLDVADAAYAACQANKNCEEPAEEAVVEPDAIEYADDIAEEEPAEETAPEETTNG